MPSFPFLSRNMMYAQPGRATGKSNLVVDLYPTSSHDYINTRVNLGPGTYVGQQQRSFLFLLLCLSVCVRGNTVMGTQLNNQQNKTHLQQPRGQEHPSIQQDAHHPGQAYSGLQPALQHGCVRVPQSQKSRDTACRCELGIQGGPTAASS